jgi:hypothetical protein
MLASRATPGSNLPHARRGNFELSVVITAPKARSAGRCPRPARRPRWPGAQGGPGGGLPVAGELIVTQDPTSSSLRMSESARNCCNAMNRHKAISAKCRHGLVQIALSTCSADATTPPTSACGDCRYGTRDLSPTDTGASRETRSWV